MVTLVVPVYNMEEHLIRCMGTLLNQTYTDYEIILVDDGSTDRSSKLCDDYSHKNEKVRVIHKKNGGLSSARNAGIQAACGDYIVFPDPDDWVEPNYVEQLLTCQEQYNADLVCLGHYIEYDDRAIPANENQKLCQMNQMEARRALLIAPTMGGFAWNKLYRLDIIRENNLCFENDVGTTEDLDFAYRYLGFCNNVCFAPEVRVYHYYQRAGAATHNGFSQHKLESIHTYDKIIATSQDVGIISAAKEEICNTATNLLWLYCKDHWQDPSTKTTLKAYLRRNICDYLKSNRYGISRKAQVICALISPEVYCFLKNKLTKG